MALTDTLTAEPETKPTSGGVEPTSVPNPVATFFGTGDHRSVGQMFIVASLLMVGVDLMIAAVGGFDLASGGDLLADDLYVRVWANLPVSLVLCGLLPLVAGLALHLVPLQIGAPTVAFPRLAALSFWSWLAGALIFSATWAFDGAYGGTRGDLPQLGNIAVGLVAVALIGASISIAVTVLGLRRSGMTIGRVPFFSFASLVAATVWVFTLPALVANVALGHISNPTPATLLDEVHPSISWLFSQPTAYIAAIPVLGLLLDSISASARSRVKFFGVVQAMVAEFGLLSFGVWAQGAGASETIVGVIFAVAIALPVLGILGAATDMLRRGKVSVSAGLVGALGAGLLLLLATLTGALSGIDSIGDGQLIGFRSGSFGAEGAGPGMVPALLMFVAAAVVVATIGSLNVWRRPMGLGAASTSMFALALAILGGLVMGSGQLIVGLADPDASGTEALSAVSGAGALLVALGVFLTLVDLLAGHVRRGDAGPEIAGGTLEFAADPAALTDIVDPYPLFELDEDGDA